MIRLHLPAIPHTITINEYSHCAFTGKVLRFSPMMKSCGFEVYHYGIETSESGATKQIDLLTKKEWENLRFESYKHLNPNLSDEEVHKVFSDNKNFIGALANWDTPLYKEFNNRLRVELQKNYRSTGTDIVCLPFGPAHNLAIAGLNVVCVESGIGYPNSYLDYRIFESHAIKHITLEKEKKVHGLNYWFVVPNYYNTLEWPLNLNPNKAKVGFFGRICHIKGMTIFVEIAKLFPQIDFIMCGQGDEKAYMTQPNIIYKPPIHGLERGEFLKELCALICPSLYMEPFCGVNVEAQLCGTPVMANDFGAFCETIEPFKTGMLCHTLADYCYGIQMALDDKFDRQYIHDRATKLYDMYNVGKQYEYVLKTILDVSNGNNGWYSPHSYLKLLNKI